MIGGMREIIAGEILPDSIPRMPITEMQPMARVVGMRGTEVAGMGAGGTVAVTADMTQGEKVTVTPERVVEAGREEGSKRDPDPGREGGMTEGFKKGPDQGRETTGTEEGMRRRLLIELMIVMIVTADLVTADLMIVTIVTADLMIARIASGQADTETEVEKEVEKPEAIIEAAVKEEVDEEEKMMAILEVWLGEVQRRELVGSE